MKHQFSRVLMIALSLVALSCQGTGFNQNRTDNLLAEFKAENQAQQLETLSNLLKNKNSASFFSFYFLLEKSELADLTMFKKAFAASGSLEAILAMGDYLKSILEFVLKEYNQNASNEEKQQVLNVRLAGFNQRLNALAPEIGKAARQNPDRLIAVLKTAKLAEDPAATAKAGGAIIGLQAMREDGFELILSSIKTEEDKSTAFSLAESFGPNAVIPTLKVFENPASSELQNNAAGCIIMSFSKTNTLVIDKVVEALRHGRYFKATKLDTIKSLEQALEMAQGWWGNFLNSHYQGESGVAEYVAKTHLNDPRGQKYIIFFVNEIDFQAAKPYLEKLDPNTLPKESLEALFHVCYPPSTRLRLIRNSEPYLKERCDLFCKTFMKCSVEKRSKNLYMAGKFPPELMAEFYVNNFAKLSKDEQNTVIYNCLREELLEESFPPNLRDQVFAQIRPLCDKEQLLTIKYLTEKKQY